MHEHLKPGEGGRGHKRRAGREERWWWGEKGVQMRGKKRMRKERKVEKKAILAKKKKEEERARLNDMRITKGKAEKQELGKKTPKSERGRKAVRGQEEGE